MALTAAFELLFHTSKTKATTGHAGWILKTSNSQLKSEEVASLDIFSKPKVTHSWTRK